MIIQNILISKIINSTYQTRLSDINQDVEIINLSDNIKKIGLLNPITAYKTSNNTFVVVTGYRRIEAMKMNNETHIAANIIKNSSSEILINLSENIMRENLNPIEIAFALDLLKKQENIKIFQLAHLINKSERYVKQHLVLLNLHEDIKNDIIKNQSKIDKKILESLARIPEELFSNQIDIYFQLKREEIDNYEAIYLIQKLLKKDNTTDEEVIFNWTKSSFQIKNIKIKEDNREEIQSKIIEIINEYS